MRFLGLCGTSFRDQRPGAALKEGEMEKLMGFIGIICFVVGISLLFAVPVWILWNMTLISVFPTISSISFGQALGLNLLAGFLLGPGYRNKGGNK